MKKILTSLFFLLFSHLFSLQAQQLQWAKQFAQNGAQMMTSITTDNQGNSYCIGVTELSNTDIDPGEGIYNINPGPIASVNHHFLIKLSPEGNFIWGKLLPQPTDQLFTSDNKILIAPDGYIYTFSYIYYSTGYASMHQILTLSKFDSDGNILQTKEIKDMNSNPTGNAHITASSFTVDNNSNIYITGFCANTIILDPDNPQFNLVTTNLFTGYGAFILKLDSNWNFAWTKVFNERQVTSSAREISLRSDGDLNLILGAEVTEPYHTFEQRLYKIEADNGTVLSQKKLLGQCPVAYAIAPNGEMAVATVFGNGYPFNDNNSTGTIDIDPSGAENLITTDYQSNLYISWLTADGDLIDAKVYYNGIYLIHDLSIDENYNLYCLGVFWQDGFDATEIDLDPGEGEMIISVDDSNIYSYVIKFNNSHNYETAFKLGEEDLHAIDIEATDENNIYLTGLFRGNNDFDPSPETYWLNSSFNGSTDGFIMKFGTCNLSAPQGESNQYLCVNSDATIANLTPNNSGIIWYDSETSATPLSPTTTINDGVTYYASKTSNCGIPNRLAVTAHISPTPTIPTAANQQFCKSENPTIANLTAIGTDIKWYADDTSTTPIESATLLINGQYYASQTTNGCESQRTAITVALITTPSPTAAASQAFCIDSNATASNLTVTGTDIKVYDSNTSTTPLDGATPLQNQSYYATQTLNGCESDRIAIAVTINNPSAPTAALTQVFCAGDSPVINNIIVTGINIKWYDAATGGNIIPGNIALTDNTTYYASQTINGCESISRCVVTVAIDSANIPAQNYQASFCDSNNDGREIVNLHDYNSHLLPSPAGYDFTYYYSENGAQNKLTSDKINNPENLPVNTGSTTVFVRIESPGGCFKIVSLKLEVAQPTPPILPESKYYICQGNNLTITPNHGFSNFNWSNGSKKNTFTINQPGNYSVTADYSHGTITCKTTFSFTVTALPETHITKVLTADWTDNDNAITIITSPGNDNEYSIDGIHYQHDNHFNNLAPGIYTIHARDINGCGYDTSEVLLLNYPKFFTPNNDGVNDYWKIENSFFEKDLNVIIFDRYGKIIKGFKNNESGWDGTLDNKPLPATDYWFVVKRAGKEYKGHFSLIR